MSKMKKLKELIDGLVNKTIRSVCSSYLDSEKLDKLHTFAGVSLMYIPESSMDINTLKEIKEVLE